MARVFNVDQLRVGGRLLTGSAEGLFYDHDNDGYGTQLAQGVQAAPSQRSIIAGSGLLGYTNNAYTSNLTLQNDLEVHVTAGAGLTVGTDDIYIGASQVTDSMLAGSISNSKLANNSISFGADVTVPLGGNDWTPKFNLVDATGYLPTRFQLASIPVDRIANGVTDAQLAEDYIKTSEIDALGGLEWDAANSDLQIKAGGVTNTHLAGGITDNKLVNDYIQTGEVDNVSIEFAGGNLNVKAGGISNNMLGGGITNAKLANSSVTVNARSGINSDISSLALGGTIVLDLDLDPTLEFDTNGRVGVADGVITNTELGVNYAGSNSKGGPANSTVNALNAPGGGGLSIVTAGGSSTDFDGSVSNFISVDSTVVRTAGAQDIEGHKTFKDDVTFDDANATITIAGNLNVKGSTVSVTQNEVNIGDNVIVLNNDITHAIAPEKGGFHIKRGSQGAVGSSLGPSASMVWDPVTGWMAGIDGSETKIHTLHDSRVFSKQLAVADTARVDFGEALGLTAGSYLFDATPNVVVSLENTFPGNNDLVAVMVTGVDTSGVDVVFSNELPNAYYRLKAMVSAI
jgi:hypothetical protein